jgi:SAM-dependent methyltransferase
MLVTDSRDGSGGTLFAGTAWHYARYRPGYPDVFFDDLIVRFHLDGTGRLLDLGCGTGQLIVGLAAHVAEAIGIDPEPEMLTEAAGQARRLNSPMSSGHKEVRKTYPAISAASIW